MRKLNFHPSALQIIYLIIYIILFFFIVYVPKLISGPFRISEKLVIEEEIIEGTLLGILFFLNILILNLYRKEASKQKDQINKISEDKKAVKEKLDDSIKYIGKINVQIQEIKSIFNNTIRFPETKDDFKKTFFYFSDRVLGIVNTDWVLFRIINCSSGKTISEQLETRPGFTTDYPHISNKMIIEKQTCPPFTLVISNPQNLNVLCCCILPVDRIINDERVFIQAITNEIAMMFVIFNYSLNNKLNKEISQNVPYRSAKKLIF